MKSYTQCSDGHSVECDRCRSDANKAFCEHHFDKELEESFDKGRSEGYDEGFEQGKKEGQREGYQLGYDEGKQRAELHD